MDICLFDIDGTLLASGGAGKAALEGALSGEFSVPVRAKVSYSGRTDPAIIRDLLRLHDIADTPANRDRLLEGYFQRLPGCLASHQGRVLPGIVNLLDHLRKHTKVAIGLLTGNLRNGARLKLGHYGLFHYFAFGGFGDNKYDRDEVAREALEEVRRHCAGPVKPERIWVIGDTPLDVRCARAIGARVAAVATGFHSLDELAQEKPDLLLADLADPSPLLTLCD